MIKRNICFLKKAYIIASVILIFYYSVFFFIFNRIDNHLSSFNSIPIINNKKIFQGYTLISPYNRLLNQDNQWTGKIYLLDLFGRQVHTWFTKHQAFYSVLKKNGNLISVMELPKYSQMFPPGGNTGRIQELDWNSRVIWEYENEAMHHDVAISDNGDVTVAIWEKTPPDIAKKIKGGTEGTEIDGTVWSDKLIEINSKGEIVWEWHSYQHLDPQTDSLGILMPKFAWTYTNGIANVAKNPIDGKEAYLISMRSLSEIMLIRKSDGVIIWRSPKGMLNTQHDPTILKNGNILVFDNGFTRAPNPYPAYGSRAVEIDPRNNKIIWQFDAGLSPMDKTKFFAPIVGGAQRLGNGNTLITDGVKGHIFEVSRDGRVVWDLVNPYVTHMTGSFPNNFLFKSRRYSKEEIAWPMKIKPAVNKSEYILWNILKKFYL